MKTLDNEAWLNFTVALMTDVPGGQYVLIPWGEDIEAPHSGPYKTFPYGCLLFAGPNFYPL